MPLFSVRFCALSWRWVYLGKPLIRVCLLSTPLLRQRIMCRLRFRGQPISLVTEDAWVNKVRCDLLRIGRLCRGKIEKLGGDERGQSTVEAAFVLPIVMLLVLFLLQPGIILYDRIVMQSAATEGCRLLSTLPSDNTSEGEDYIKRRLSAVPQQDLFHVHSDSACSWVIELVGNETTSQVSVSILTEVKPLPLLDIGAALLGMTNDEGNLEVKVEAQLQSQPDWVLSDEGSLDPTNWIGAWA